MPRPVISAYLRSPFTLASKGALTRVRPDDMAAQVIKALMSPTKVKAEDIEDLVDGLRVPGRRAGPQYRAPGGIYCRPPISVAGTTVNRFCGSSMEAIHMAAGKIAAGAGEAFICAGVESMTRIPMGGFNPAPNPGLYANYPQAYDSMGKTAEALAKKYTISRKEQEEFALKSHKKAAAANMSGEIVPITAKAGTV